MNKTYTTGFVFPIENFDQQKQKMLNWAQQFGIFCFLDNHQYQTEPHNIECLLAAGVRRSLTRQSGAALQDLQSFIKEKPSWLFGHLGYDLKNEIENLQSLHPDHIHFPDLFFFEPKLLIRLTKTQMIIEAEDADKIFREISFCSPHIEEYHTSTTIKNRLTKEEYIAIIKKLQQHIIRGDCYEINFCQEFFAEDVSISPVFVYQQLSTISPNPFSALYRTHDKYLICASPERYLQKKGNKIVSQPIKGTSKRISTNENEEAQHKLSLYKSAKDRAENVMVVDLVRNDLSRICKEGTVQVEELYGIYAFPQVYQMISTISGELADEVSLINILRATFPMGSMTGAPKHNVLKLIEQYEPGRRGIFSGALGYITPEGDFDFNVVIRSLLYNSSAGYLSFPAGSGITFYSNPDKEWEECLVKAEAIRKILDKNHSV